MCKITRNIIVQNIKTVIMDIKIAMFHATNLNIEEYAHGKSKEQRDYNGM